jgi:hypothetical protein
MRHVIYIFVKEYVRHVLIVPIVTHSTEPRGSVRDVTSFVVFKVLHPPLVIRGVIRADNQESVVRPLNVSAPMRALPFIGVRVLVKAVAIIVV